MGRLCFALTLVGGLVALLGAALYQGLSSPGGGGGYGVDVIGAWSFSGGPGSSEFLHNTSESQRYLTASAVGAVIGLGTGVVLHLVGVRVDAGTRVGLTVLAGLVGCTVGLLPALIPLATGAEPPAGLSPLELYAVAGTLAYALALAAVHLALRAVGDPGTKPTTHATAVVLPIGAVLATAAGVFSAWVLGFSTVNSTWIVVFVEVILILCASFAVSRGVGMRRHAAQER